jgi:hypothetical protein
LLSRECLKFRTNAAERTHFNGRLSLSGKIRKILAGQEIRASWATDGRVYLVVVDGFDSASLLITPTQRGRETANVLQRLLGKRRITYTYLCICPACRQSFEIPTTGPGQAASWPYCRRSLRLSQFVKTATQAATNQ